MIASASITITQITDGLTTFYQYAKNASNTVAPSIGWDVNIPASEAGKFIWRREGYALAYNEVPSWVNAMCLTGATGTIGPQGPTGPQGPAGTPGHLGLYAVATTLYLKGYDADGILQAGVGYIYPGWGNRIAVPAYSQVLTGSGQGYVLFDDAWTQKVRLARMVPQSGSIAWHDYNSDASLAPDVTSTTFVVGMFAADGVDVTDVALSPGLPQSCPSLQR